MANSAGGILIYGVAESSDPARRHLPGRIDPVNRTNFSKEWLENIITQIRPKIPNLKIHPVQFSSASDNVVYVVEIPEGTTAYQATDFRYYRRYNFQLQPMVDHEIRDVMNRKKHPRIAITAKLAIYQRSNKDGDVGALVVNIINESNVFARHVYLIFHSPIKINNRIISYRNATVDSGDDGAAFKLQYSNQSGPPLFPNGSLKQIFPFGFGAWRNPEPVKQLSYFRWVVFADSMPMESGLFKVEEIISTPSK